MELPDIGLQCDAENCRQLNFLPLMCILCGKIFCTEHFRVHVPACIAPKTVSKDVQNKIHDVFVCCQDGCNEKSIIELKCERCQEHFCIKHRHLSECTPKSVEILAAEKEKYAAPVRQFNEAKALVDEQIEGNLQQAKKKAKNRDTAVKIQLMRIKNKASGLKSIPITNRVYFNVSFLQNSVRKIIPVFVSDQWSLGRVIDAIADECKLQNNNNKSGEKKLRLFRSEDNKIVSKNMSENLHQMLSQQIVLNGDSLIIEYVDENCESLL